MRRRRPRAAGGGNRRVWRVRIDRACFEYAATSEGSPRSISLPRDLRTPPTLPRPHHHASRQRPEITSQKRGAPESPVTPRTSTEYRAQSACLRKTSNVEAVRPVRHGQIDRLGAPHCCRPRHIVLFDVGDHAAPARREAARRWLRPQPGSRANDSRSRSSPTRGSRLFVVDEC